MWSRTRAELWFQWKCRLHLLVRVVVTTTTIVASSIHVGLFVIFSRTSWFVPG
jgi:hypothetical protein